jgi:hypothetical protein
MGSRAVRPIGYRPYRREPVPASIWLRLCGAIADFSLLAVLAVVVDGFLPWRSAPASLSVTVADMVLALVEVLAGTSVGKLVAGLEIEWTDDTLLRRVSRAGLKYFLAGFAFLPAFFNRRHRGLHDLAGGSIVCQRPARARVLRALGTIAACGYFAVTFGVGRLFDRLVDVRIDAGRVDAVPAEMDVAQPSAAPGDSIEFWSGDLRVRFPRPFPGCPIQSGAVALLIGGGGGERVAGPRLLILSGGGNHPFVQCSASGPAWRHILDCSDPRAAQRGVFAMRRADRWYLTPYGMAVTNGRLILKQQYVKGGPQRFFMRAFESAGLLVDWIGREDVEPSTQRVSRYDDLWFATEAAHAELVIIWADRSPDEHLVEAAIRSAVLQPPTPREIDEQVSASERSGKPLGALNAMRAGNRDRHTVQVAVASLRATGLPWERQLFASWLRKLADEDASLRDLADGTRAWLPREASHRDAPVPRR